MSDTIREIYFDRQTIRILRYIRRNESKTERDIAKKFKEHDGISWLLISMCRSSYLVATTEDGRHTMFDDGSNDTNGDFRYWVTPKGRKLLEDRFDRLWQWVIPTVISVVALVVSALSAI